MTKTNHPPHPDKDKDDETHEIHKPAKTRAKVIPEELSAEKAVAESIKLGTGVHVYGDEQVRTDLRNQCKTFEIPPADEQHVGEYAGVKDGKPWEVRVYDRA